MHILSQTGVAAYTSNELWAGGLPPHGNLPEAKWPIGLTVVGRMPEARISQGQSVQILQRARYQIVGLFILVRHHDDRGDGKLQGETLLCR